MATEYKTAVQLLVFDTWEKEMVRATVRGVNTLGAATLAVQLGHLWGLDFHVVEGAGQPLRLYWVGRPTVTDSHGRPQRAMTEAEIRAVLEAKL